MLKRFTAPLCVTLSFLFVTIAVMSHAQDRERIRNFSAPVFDLEAALINCQKLFLLPGVESVLLELDVTWTIYEPSNFAQAILDGYIPRGAEAELAHYSEEWLEKQLGARSQTYQQSISISDIIWAREVIAPAGDIFPIDQHQLLIVDLNENERTSVILNHPRPDTATDTQPINEQTYTPLRYSAYNPVSMGELMGLRDSLLLPLELDELTQSQIQIGSVLSTYYTTDAGIRVAQFEETDGRLLSAVYLEDSRLTAPTRELIYGEYVTDPVSGVVYPSEVTLKRYLGTGIEQRSLERLTEEATVRITSITTDF